MSIPIKGGCRSVWTGSPGHFDRIMQLAQKDDNITISAFVGFQPEITWMEHRVISTRLGLDIPLTPDFMIQTAGSWISIVGGASFKILF